MTPDRVVTELAFASDADATRRAMAEEVRTGLLRSPRELPCKYFYDKRGSELFDRITQLPEYYLTRMEAELLRGASAEIASLVRPEAIVELGAGYCTKSRLLISAARRVGSLGHFVPVDVSPDALEEASRFLRSEYPGLQVHGLVAEFEGGVDVPRYGRRLVVFLGSTIGNLDDGERAAFLAGIRGMLEQGDAFLLGVDLVKDVDELNAAYNDSAGVSAEFNRNLLRVLNRELGANFDIDSFEHVSAYSEERKRIETHLRSLRRQVVRIPACALAVDFEDGELVHTEISVKFERASLAEELRAAGLQLRQWFTDPAQRFALALASP